MKKFWPALAVVALLLAGAAAPLWAAEGGGYSELQWKDLLYRLLCFAVLAAVLLRVARRPVVAFFRERRENIARNLEYLETQAHNLEEQRELMGKQIANIASERDAILAQYERLGQKEADRLIAEAQAAAVSLLEKAKEAMEMEIKSARQVLLAEIVNLSTQAARELLRKNITPDDQKRLTREFMDQVEKLASPH
ncbi:MAG: ATP synthase F0 subunit B [Candidatus Adiutrix sp.]|jgi:F-type H+-transporting ATPase subunit b|nr:ATP synthase F0 subunit B [Candidatus Adiutrix sp.]